LENRISGFMDKIRQRKIIVAILLVGVVAFSVTYAFTQTKTGFAVLTSPPPGIPGPYYVTAEAKIYGPVVDLAAIKSKMGGTYASDYTYVQWETNPFYRVYVDNTLQEVYSGQMIDIMDQFNWNFAIENNSINTFNGLKNVGAIDSTSILGEIDYFGNLPGVFLTYYYHDLTMSGPAYGVTNVSCSSWRAAEIRGEAGSATISLNGSLVLPGGGRLLNASGGSGGTLEWDISYAGGVYHYDITRGKARYYNYPYGPWWDLGYVGITIYLENLSWIENTMSNMKFYNVSDSPGTGFVSKSVSPGSPVIQSTVDILAQFDPPAANNVNLTDLYPNTFSWAGSQVTLEKYRIGVGLVASAFLSVTPTPVGSNMKISIDFDLAPAILQLLLSDEYVQMSYALIAPSTSGEYTLPSATMSYSIQLPQT